MDLDDDDSFLYGEETSPPAQNASAPCMSFSPFSVCVRLNIGNSECESQWHVSRDGCVCILVDNNECVQLTLPIISALASYGLDPSAAVKEDNPEDGGVEEEVDDDEDSDSDDEDDVKLVFTTGASRLDLR